ncbi:hypothetical protein HWV62_15393 [Athelia sp. TMB]|nr:hypothetical protein HWV62_15393 [Athelia sp. TMB]
MSRGRLADSGPPTKRPKLDARGGYKFTSADEIRRSLRNKDQDNLIQTLTALRNQLTVKPDETIPLQDERILLAQNWMDVAPGAHDLFEAWEGANQPIVATLLSPQWMRRLISNLGGSHNELILVTLKLLNAMSSFSGGRDRKSLCETFPWETKTLPKLLFMRRKSKSDSDVDAMARPDIRTSYILFIISFVDPDTPSIVKQTFLEQHRDVFLSLFKSIAQDPYPLLRRVLEVCWTGIWYDPKIKRTLKIGLFGESTIAQGLNVAKLIKLYDRVSTESAETEHIPADLVHHFLLAICTRPGVGICFKDRGWYPRETDGEDRAAHVEEGQSGSKTGRIYNKILSNVLKTLKVNDDMRQQELALKIMSACPELVAGYWTAAALTLEPRLSSKWIANVSFFGSVISLPVPSASFFLPGSELLHPSPPPLANILENTFPSVNTKHNLSKGLQSSSSLVQHCTALALARCLSKYAKVISAFEHVQNALDEDEEDGQWRKRRREVEREVRRRVPEFQVIVGFSQQKIAEGVQAINPVKLALLAESAQRLLWLYHRCLPSMAAEARFDVGKLLQGSFKPSAPISEDSASDYDASIRLGLVRELHVLRLLKESDQFAWSTKASSSQYSYLNILLKMFSATEVLATRLTITSLLKVVLSESILFQEDPEEVDLWLESLPTTRRAVNAESPDGAALTDEADSVVNFLDDCMQRCLKTPYRYIEERDSMATSALADEQLFSDHTATPCSPLLLVVLEQLGAKIAAELLSPSDLLALSMFVRLLVFKLSSKQHDTRFFSIMTDKFDSLLRDDLFAEYPNVINAIRREMSILRFCIGHTHVSPASPCDSASAVVQEFLDRVEEVGIPESRVLRAQAAFELCDWIRLADHPLHVTELKRLASIVSRLYPRALSVLFQNLGPHQGSVWDYQVLDPTEVSGVHFDWLFICLQQVVDACLDPVSEDDKKFAGRFSSFWAESLKAALVTQSNVSATPVAYWIKYLDTEALLDLMNALCSNINNHPFSEVSSVLEAVMVSLSQSSILHPHVLESNLKSLLALRSYLAGSVLLDTMIAQVISNSLPASIDGFLPAIDEYRLSTTSNLADIRWARKSVVVLESLDISAFLSKDHWTDATSQVIAALLYTQPKSRGIFRHWITINGHQLDAHEIATTLIAYLDCVIAEETPLHDTEHDMLIFQCSRMLSVDSLFSKPSPSTTSFSRYIYLTAIRLQSSPVKLVSLLQDFAQHQVNKELSSELLTLVRKLSEVLGNEIDGFAASIIDHGLQAAVRLLSSGLDSPGAWSGLDRLARLLECTKQVKVYLAEPVIIEVIQNHLSNETALHLALRLVQCATLKPASVNRFLQMTVQNTSFYKYSAISTTTRNSMVHLLHDLFHAHPINTCQPSHLEPLLLSVFRLFEAHRKTSSASLLCRWSSSSDVSTSPLEATLSLEPIRVLRTCLAFPTSISLGPDDPAPVRVGDSLIYDPNFVISLVAHTLLVSPPTSALHWVQFFRTNVVSLLVRCLSARDCALRSAALSQIANLWKYLETADMQEQPHVVYILAQLKNTLPTPSSAPTRRLPAYTTLILLHSLRGVFYPSNFIYPLTARFLLQRPEVDTGDVPMLYNMLYNSSDDWKKERAWIIRFLADGMTSTEDWRVFKRRHTWELLSSLFQSAENDLPLRLGVLEAVTSLVLKSSLLTWIEMQMRSAAPGERLAWAKILHNIILVIRPGKLEAAVGLEWRSAMCRSLLLLISDDSATLATIFPYVADVALRLSLLSGISQRHLGPLVNRLLEALKSFEPKIQLAEPYQRPHQATVPGDCMLHGSFGLHETSQGEEDLLHVWGKGVETLWRVTMNFTEKSAAWDVLSCRLLLWRALVGEEGSQVGEWERKEIIRAL